MPNIQLQTKQGEDIMNTVTLENKSGCSIGDTVKVIVHDGYIFGKVLSFIKGCYSKNPLELIEMQMDDSVVKVPVFMVVEVV